MTDTDTSPEAVERLATYHDWRDDGDSDTAATLRSLSARVTELEAANDAAEKSYRISDNGNLWRFWSDKAREMSSKFNALRKRAEAAEAKLVKVVGKASAVVDRWDSIDWKQPHTADFINDLRATLAAITDG